MYRGAQKSVKLYKEVKFFLWIKKMVYCYLISINAVFAQLISWKINLLERFKKVKFIAYLYFTVHIFERHITCNLQCNQRSTTCVREIWLEKIYTMLLCLKTFWWMVKKKWLDTYIVKTLWFFFSSCINDLYHRYFLGIWKMDQGCFDISLVYPRTLNIWNISM